MFLKDLSDYVIQAILSLGVYFSPLYAENMEGHGIWDNPNIPHTGWYHQGVEDLENTSGICEMCHKKGIRFMHKVSHDQYKDLRVGFACAEKMTQDYINPKKREALAQKEAIKKGIQSRKVLKGVENVPSNWLNLQQWLGKEKESR